VFSRLVDVQAPRFAAPVGPWLSESGRDRNRRSPQAARCNLELVSLGDGGLVDVAGENQLGAGVDERGENVGSTSNGLFPRPPRRPDQVVVKGDDSQRALGRCREELGSALQLH